MTKRREQIPSRLKASVRERQKNKCACCMERGVEFHHILAVGSFGDSDTAYYNIANNIILLCKEHHKKFHLVEQDTVEQVYEYAYWIIEGALPERIDHSDVMRLVTERVRDQCEEAKKVRLITGHFGLFRA